eukprot:4877703-Prorocentrum_lima.AAC.1
MTSSLVGSEMCIRDSGKTLELIPRDAHSRLSKMEASHRLRKKHLRIFRPVSYTHLTLPTICSV